MRLAIIYRKQKDYYNEIRVLDRAIYVFDSVVNKMRGDRLPKLREFIERRGKSQLLMSKGDLKT